MTLKDDLAASPPELKPCPFCGGEAYMRDDVTHSTAVFIGCEKLTCFGHAHWEETEAQAIALWNTRAPDMAAALIEIKRQAREEGIPVAAALAAAISLLERGGKKAAPSDKMFAQMLRDYRRALNDYRARLDPDISVEIRP